MSLCSHSAVSFIALLYRIRDADCENSIVWADRSRRTKGGVACYWRVRSEIGSVESRKADIDAAIWTCIGTMH